MQAAETKGTGGVVDRLALLDRMLKGGTPTREAEVERAWANLVALDGEYPAEAIAARMVDCLVQRRLP